MLLKDSSLYKEIIFSAQEFHKQEIDTFTLGSKRKLWWFCSEKHEYSATISHRANGSGCPYCAGVKILSGFNDLATLHPKISKEWHPTRNREALPTLISKSSKVKYWWQCDKDHEWEATPKSRILNKSNCPYCAKNRSLTHSFRPLLLREYDLERNDKPLTFYTQQSSAKVWWVCHKNPAHKWETRIFLRNDKIKGGTNCPYCNYSNRSSQAESELNDFLEQIGIPFISGTRKIIPPKELDFYFPSLGIAIEYNGLYWHSENAGKKPSYHYNKYKECQNKGIQLIQIWEDDWLTKPELIRSYLTDRLKPRRFSSIKNLILTTDITKTDVDNFINKNSLYPKPDYTFKVGIKVNEELVSMLLLEETLNEIVIKNYSTNYIVENDLYKMANYIISSPLLSKKLVLFVDNSFPNEIFYTKNGFKKIAEIPADFTYLHKGKRIKESLTTSSLGDQNRIWNAGQIKLIFENN